MDWLVSSQLQAGPEVPPSTWIPAKEKRGWVLLISLHIFHRHCSVPLLSFAWNCSFPPYPTFKLLPYQESTFSLIFTLDNICVCRLWFLLPLIWHTRPLDLLNETYGYMKLAKNQINHTLCPYFICSRPQFWDQKFRHGSFSYSAFYEFG